MTAAAAPARAPRGDSIAAVSTPAGSSARGLVRVSGDDAFDVVAGRLASGTLARTRSIQVVRVAVRWEGALLTVPCTALVMPAPASFTGQDTVELLLPGNAHLLEAAVATLCDGRPGAASASRAGPGAFSARAFAAGRLPLAEAERISLSISAESAAQLAAAATLRDSPVARAADAAAKEVTALLALVEAGIDFTDQEDVVAIESGHLARRTLAAINALQDVVRRSVPEEALRPLPMVALNGAPNAGKSSVFNALLGRSRSVESDLAGSTRDAIIEPLPLSTGEVLLCDLPGIEDPHHALAAQMQLARRGALQRAGLAVRCVPLPDLCLAANATRSTDADPHRPQLCVWTKADQATAAQRSAAEQAGGVVTSARTGEGIDQLRAALAQELASAHGPHGAPLLLERHRCALAAATQHMEAVATMAGQCEARGNRSADPAELIALELRCALDELGTVAGHRTSDDVLAELFRRFCVGK